ncbi:MAG: hypothetical protein K8M05_24875 [Deltaproteobacteria bacterium]|nr:hypothetical protein [Kofleriaceae bacterium]
MTPAARSAAALGAVMLASAAPAAAQEDDGLDIHPLLGVAGGVMYNVERNRNFESEQRDEAVTVAISRVGVTGTIGHGVSFKVEYERSLGNENGSGVWEGTAGWGALEQWVRYERAGFRADAGVVFDEATAVFGSAHAGGLFYRDRYTRNIGLWGGAFFGQGVIVKYAPAPGLTLGVSYAAANPLAHTNSFLIDGTSGGSTRFYAASLLNSSFGQPSAAVHFQTVMGSARYEAGGLTAQASGAWLEGDAKTNSDEDRLLTGWIARAGARYEVGRVRAFANATYMWNRAQDRALSSAYADYQNDVLFGGAGVDVAIARAFGAGAWWAGTQRQLDDAMDPRYREQWLNVGATYAPHRQFYVQLRVGYFRQDIDNTAASVGQQQELAGFATSTLQL